MTKIVIITGASSGIGKAIAEKFMNNGDYVILLGRNLVKLGDIESNFKGLCEQRSIDVSNEVNVRELFTDIGKKFGVIDVLVNAAGFAKTVSTKSDIAEAVSSWNEVIATNLTGSFLMSIYAAPLLRRPGGRIVNISSIGAFTGGSSGGAIAYAASKSGINGLTFGFARELSKDGITVNSIAPGFIENTGFTSVYSKDIVDQIVKSVPANRAGNVDDVAEACYYLSSEKASYITGEILNVNGGWLFGR
jgi:3-oxoacyl-[acyl-carrier protein] reductase